MIQTFIGYSADQEIHYKASSGGVGSSIIKYLFENKIIETSITFTLDPTTLQYIPQFIYCYKDYEITGSIYQEINLIKFIKDNCEKIRGTFACFVLPCQAKAIRNILKNAGIDSILLGLTCSSQQSIDATYYLFERLQISKEDVKHIQYRGNGWPSGIQIELYNKKNIFIANNHSIWSDIFHSRLFIPKRCFYCTNTLNNYSDIALADPWIKEILKSEHTGKSLIICYTDIGNNIIKKCIASETIKAEHFDYTKIIDSQKSTILRKQSYAKNHAKLKIYINIINSAIYRKIILQGNLLKIHNKLKSTIERKIFK